MGLDSAAVNFLLGCRARGVDFSDMMMIGRQAFFPDRGTLAYALTWLGWRGDIPSFLAECQGYSEPLFRLLGAKTIESLDISSYENATHIHDLNLPIDDALKGRYSVVLDCGTIEHIFNFPQAVKNCLSMVKVGGHFILATIANNYMAHGFYQFSPELFYRLVSGENGFVAEGVVLFEFLSGSRWYQAFDPKVVGRRAEFWNRGPVSIMILAKRVADVPILATFPQQSDYVTMWEQAVSGPAPPNTLLHRLRKRLPRRLKDVGLNLCRWWLGGPSFRRDFYKRLSLSEVRAGQFG